MSIDGNVVSPKQSRSASPNVQCGGWGRPLTAPVFPLWGAMREGEGPRGEVAAVVVEEDLVDELVEVPLPEPPQDPLRRPHVRGPVGTGRQSCADRCGGG